MEVADSPAAVSEWTKLQPSERTGPPPRKPLYKVSPFTEPLKPADRIHLADTRATATDWVTSDRIQFTSPIDPDRFDPQQVAALSARSLARAAVPLPPSVKNPPGGPPARRASAVDDVPVAPRTMTGSLSANLATFHVDIGGADNGTYEAVPIGEFQVQQPAKAAIAAKILAMLSKLGAPSKFREDLPKGRRATAPVAKSYSYLEDIAAGPNDPPEPFISAWALRAMWRFDYGGGTLLLIRQGELYGTAPDAGIVPRDVEIHEAVVAG
jgi:hypothetical protein